MQNVSKTVLKRMQAPPPGAHPDADLLTAFAEQSLVKSERTSVIEHLARCGDCREIVALALPSPEAVALPIRVTSPRSRWLSWPVLRWGVVAAGVALASVGVLQYRRSQQPALVSTLTVPEKSPIAAAPSPAPVQPARTASEASSATTETKHEMRGALPHPEPQAGSAGETGEGSGDDMAPRIASPLPAVDAKRIPSTTSEAVEVQSAAAPVATGEEGQAQAHLSQNQIAVQGRSFTKLDAVAKAKAPVPAQSTSAPAPAFAPPAMPLQTSPALMLHASPRWTISADGGLQRSFDAGQSWEDISVAAAAPVSASRGQATAGGMYESDKNQNQSVKSALKKKSAPPSNPIFRAVSAMGPEVWAGGSNAALFHSPDSGIHWTQVLPAESGAALTGDITAIEFSDPLNGKIVTSVPEFWTTADGGQTWHKEQ
jgi:hypothetical protein